MCIIICVIVITINITCALEGGGVGGGGGCEIAAQQCWSALACMRALPHPGVGDFDVPLSGAFVACLLLTVESSSSFFFGFFWCPLLFELL